MLNGSSNQKGNTHQALQIIGEQLKADGIDYEIFQLGAGPVRDCIGCGQCSEEGCVFVDDPVNTFIAKAKAADGIVFGTPVYYAHPSGRILSFLDRVFYSSSHTFAFKPGAALAIARRGGTTASFDVMNKYFGISQMPIAGSTYWNLAHGGAPGEVAQDAEGIETMVNLAKNLGWMMKCFDAGKKEGIALPDTQEGCLDKLYQIKNIWRNDMKTINIVNGPQNVPALIQGCMRMPALSTTEAATVIRTAYEQGINYFDHATCYGENGVAETRFGDAFSQTGLTREDVLLQSKCGLCFERNEFDWTKENILSSVDDSLRRLKTEYLDVLLLHRPEVLYDPEEVAAAFDVLEQSGKVTYFGVSNLVPMQIELLKKYVRQPLLFNQQQLSLEQSQLIDQALYMNNKSTEFSISRDGNALDYCRLNDITIQAWSPLQHGMFKGTFVDNADFPELNKVLAEMGDREGVSKTAIALAWILRHPAKMQAIIGTMNPEHIKDACDAVKVSLSHHDWYALYLAAGKYLP